MIEFNGKKYARVSEILAPFSTLGDIPKEVLNRKARVGTNVHQAICDQINGDFAICTEEEERYLISFTNWEDQIKPVFMMSEKRYFDNEKMFTGQIDAIIDLNGEQVLVDFKTSANESPTWIMQGHLYRHLVKIETGIEIDRFLFLKLDKYGNMPKVFEYKFTQNIHLKCMKAVDDFWKITQK